jgi:uroporphyrinogen decarboxylase
MMYRDEFNHLMRGGKTDSVPFWEVWFLKWKMVKKRYGDPQLIESRIQMARDLGMAALSLGSVNMDCIFFKEQQVGDGSTRYAGGGLVSLDQLDQFKPPDWSSLIIELKEKQAKINQAGLAGVLYMPWCFHAINTSMGFENLCYKLYEDRGFLKTCMSWLEERNREAIEEVVSVVQPDAVLFDGDCAYGNGLMISPDDLKELTYDETAKTVKLLQQLDIPHTIHSDGKLDDLIPMLVDLGFSAVHGCEKQANDLEYLVDKFGDDICLIGNMDVVFLTHSSIDEIRAETKKMIQIGSRKKRFIAACNTSPLDYIPDENYRTFCDVIKQHHSL